MTTYNLYTLTPEDFQELANTVFEEEYKIPITSFRPNVRDGGMDGSGITDDNKMIVLQSKHTSEPNAKLTMSKLQFLFITDEFEKVRSLVQDEICHRYYAVTNYSVTGGQNIAFTKKFRGTGVEVAQLIGKETLKRWILKLPPNKLKNLQLLCSGKKELLMSSEALKQSYKKDLQSKIRWTEPFEKAEEKLRKEGYVFLLGESKSGKTRMMEQLALTSDTGEDLFVLATQANDVKDNAYKNSYIFMIDDIFGRLDKNNKTIAEWEEVSHIMSWSVFTNSNKTIITSHKQIYEEVKTQIPKNFRKYLENSLIDLSHDKDLQNKIAAERSESPTSPDSSSKESKRSATNRKKGNQQSSSSSESSSKPGKSSHGSSSSTKKSPNETKKGHVSIDAAILSHREALEQIVNEAKRSKIKLEAVLEKVSHNVKLDDILQTSLRFKVSCPDLNALESLWEDYLSGKLHREVSSGFELNGFSSFDFEMYISPEEYLSCFHEFKANKLVPELSFHKLNKSNFADLAISAVEDAYGIHLVEVHSEEVITVKNSVEKIEHSGQVHRDQNVALTAVFASKDGIEIGNEKLVDIFGFGDEKKEKQIAKEEVDVYFVATNYKLLRRQEEKLRKYYQKAGIKHPIILDVNHLKILVYKSVTVQRVLLHLFVESLNNPDEGKRKSSPSLESNSKRSKSTSSPSTKASATETKKGRGFKQKQRKRVQKRPENRKPVGILHQRFKYPTKGVANHVVRRGSDSPYKRTFEQETSLGIKKARKVF